MCCCVVLLTAVNVALLLFVFASTHLRTTVSLYSIARHALRRCIKLLPGSVLALPQQIYHHNDAPLLHIQRPVRARCRTCRVRVTLPQRLRQHARASEEGSQSVFTATATMHTTTDTCRKIGALRMPQLATGPRDCPVAGVPGTPEPPPDSKSSLAVSCPCRRPRDCPVGVRSSRGPCYRSELCWTLH